MTFEDIFRLKTTLFAETRSKLWIQVDICDWVVLFCVVLFCAGLVSIPLFTVYMVTVGVGWPLGHFVCNLWLQLDYALCYTSLLSIFLICIDRYWSVSNSVSAFLVRHYQYISNIPTTSQNSTSQFFLLYAFFGFLQPFLSFSYEITAVCFEALQEDVLYAFQ